MLRKWQLLKKLEKIEVQLREVENYCIYHKTGHNDALAAIVAVKMLRKLVEDLH